jgi:hypothetical protein
MHKYENMHARRLKIIGGNPALYTVHVILMHEKFMRKGCSENLRNSIMISKRFSITGILSFLIYTFIGKSTNSTSIIQLASSHLLWIILHLTNASTYTIPVHRRHYNYSFTCSVMQ